MLAGRAYLCLNNESAKWHAQRAQCVLRAHVPHVLYFFVTEDQKSSKNKNSQPQLKNFTGSYIKKAYIISR